MRHAIAVALLLLFASAADAMEQGPSPATVVSAQAPAGITESMAPLTSRRPDYSREALLRFVASSSEDHPPIPRRVQWGLGTVEFPLFGTRFRLIWLPILPTLTPIGRYGSIKPMVDPFEMTGGGLDLPMKPETSAERRELRRIERRLRRDKKQ
jgi:hypothetical protein